LTQFSCQSELEQPYEIKKLRILGVRADYPQVKVELNSNIPVFTPNQVNFEILAADPESSCKGSGFSYRLSVCIPQQYNDDSSYSIDCEGDNGIPINGYSMSPLSFFIELFNRYQNVGQINFPVDIILNGDKMKLPVPVMAKVSNDKEETIAIKFVEFVNYNIENKNPIIEKIFINDIDVTSKNYNFALISNREYKITPIIDKTSLDKIYYEVENRYEDEGIQFSFFAQKGKFDKVATSDKFPDVVYTTPYSDIEQYTSIYIVARDFRGGIHWVIMDCIKILPESKE